MFQINKDIPTDERWIANLQRLAYKEAVAVLEETPIGEQYEFNDEGVLMDMVNGKPMAYLMDKRTALTTAKAFIVSLVYMKPDEVTDAEGILNMEWLDENDSEYADALAQSCALGFVVQNDLSVHKDHPDAVVLDGTQFYANCKLMVKILGEVVNKNTTH